MDKLVRDCRILDLTNLSRITEIFLRKEENYKEGFFYIKRKIKMINFFSERIQKTL